VLYEEMEGRDFEIVAVALDTGGKAAVEEHLRAEWLKDPSEDIRRLMGWSEDAWAKKAPPVYTCLIDEKHQVADLYGMTIVPMAVWIDEDGRIVRPTETAGMSDFFRRMDRETFRMPEEDAAMMEHNRMTYYNAVRDWAINGADSVYALAPEEVRSKLRKPSPADARATAHARIGTFLFQRGDDAAARAHFEEAVRLVPDKWNYRRQSMVLRPELIGELNTAEELWAAQDALGEADYHPRIDMPGVETRPQWLKEEAERKAGGAH
jgi:hypothetical protein